MDSIRFDHPEFLWLALVAIPAAFAGAWFLRGAEPLRRWTIIVLRSVLVVALAILLASPRIQREHHQLTVIGLLDVSGSVRRFADLPEIPDLGDRGSIEYLRWWFREATRMRLPDDRFGLVVFDGRAAVISTPSTAERSIDDLDLELLEGTDIAEAIELGLAMLPPDTAKRLVLVSDGNQTNGDAVEAARRAAGRAGAQFESVAVEGADRFGQIAGVPIDVAPIAYRIERDARIVRLEAPPTGRPEQVVTLRIVLDSLLPQSGFLTLEREGSPVDLTPGEDGSRRLVELPAGLSVHTARVALGATPINRFEAIFEPRDPGADDLAANNRAEAFVASPGRGSVLIVRGSETPTEAVLAAMLSAADLPVTIIDAARLPEDILTLQGHDLVILENVAANEVSTQAQETLARYVNDLGGGLVMTGGVSGFGAGGWNGTVIESILPVELDLPKELRLSHAALVLVLDKSGSMSANVAGTRRTQQRIANDGVAAAIRSLQRDSLVGVVAFDSFPRIVVPLDPNDEPETSIEAVRGIVPAGGTDMGPALRRAQGMLEQVDTRNKYVVCLTDGESQSPAALPGIVAEMAAQGINVSTIAVGDEADHALLKELAEIGQGEFYPVLNPATLPAVLVDSVRVVNRPLLKEVTFAPVVAGPISPLTTGLSQAPSLEGLVLTAARSDARVTIELTTPEDEPLLAHWQAGLGRVVAFTSDAMGDWTASWREWEGASTFWTQLARFAARAPADPDFEMDAAIIEGRLVVSLDVLDAGDQSRGRFTVPGTVYDPSGGASEIVLRQSGPGRFEASVEAPRSGTYVVALTPRQGGRAIAPIIGGATQPAGIEFQRYRSNIALLEAVAAQTRGRLLDLADPGAVDLFDRRGLPRSVSLLPAWQGALWILIAMLLADVAARRVAWDRLVIARAFSAAIARVRNPKLKAEEARTTLASLRARSDDLDATIARDSSAFAKLSGDARLRSGAELGVVVNPTDEDSGSGSNPSDDPRGARDEELDRRREAERIQTEAARAAKIAAALDEFAGPSGREPDRSPPSPARTPVAPSVSPAPPPSDTTSGLLAAKRRLRDRKP